MPPAQLQTCVSLELTFRVNETFIARVQEPKINVETSTGTFLHVRALWVPEQRNQSRRESDAWSVCIFRPKKEIESQVREKGSPGGAFRTPFVFEVKRPQDTEGAGDGPVAPLRSCILSFFALDHGWLSCHQPSPP